MPVAKLLPRATIGVALAAILLAISSTAGAAPGKQRPLDRAPFDDSMGAMQHGGLGDHLPGSSENVELIGELEPLVPFGEIVPGQIADLAVYKDFAYLNSWNEPTCTKGGFYAVDIRDPRHPQQVAFEPALEGRYHGEGAHVITVDTKTFTGDLLAVNNEFCTDAPTAGGGFDLYDVTDPAHPAV